jgi:hypothetical protein
MDPFDPLDAQQMVIAYARVLERDLEEQRHPARLDSLPFAKPFLKTAIRTSVVQLARTGHLTEELRDYFQTAYVSLADYLDGELVDLLIEYRQSAERLTTEAGSARERTQTPAWRSLAASGSLAGEVARSTTLEAGALQREFQGFLSTV